MKWSEIPRPAKAYILYHTLISPQLIVWYLMPLYMLKTGYSVMDVGALFTLVNIAFVPLTYLIGKFFNRYPLKHGLILIDVLDGIAYVLYSLAHGAMSSLMLFAGRLMEKVSSLFYPLYQAYEQIIYPRDRYEEIYAWHLRLPEVSQLMGFLILGYLFSYVWNTPHHYRMAFLFFGLFSIVTVSYLYVFLPAVGKRERITPQGWRFPSIGEYGFLLLVEGLRTLAWALVPGFVLIYYVVVHLKHTLFHVMLIEAGMSLTTILATYVSERIPSERGMLVIGLGFLLETVNVGVMSFSPSLMWVVIAYALGRFGDALSFPFYRTWIFSFIPRERTSEFHSALSSYNRLIGLISPAIAGFLAALHPALPYRVGLILLPVVAGLFIYKSR